MESVPDRTEGCNESLLDSISVICISADHNLRSFMKYGSNLMTCSDEFSFKCGLSWFYFSQQTETVGNYVGWMSTINTV
jgi:hypothetical protein